MALEYAVYCEKTGAILVFEPTWHRANLSLTALKAAGHQHLTVLPAAEAQTLREASFRKGPTEIDAEHYNHMRLLFQPYNLVATDHGESFKLSERTCGNITSIYAKIGERHFVLQDDMFLDHNAICAMIEASQAFLSTLQR